MNDIQLIDVSYSIRKGFWLKKTKLLHDISFEINEGEAVALVGQNGAGKTTLFKVAAGLMAPDRGTAHIHGTPSSRPESRAHLSFLTENQYVTPHLTIQEWLRFMGKCIGMDRGTCQTRADALMAEYELLPHKNKPMKELSKGLRQRAMLAQLFLNEPRILILDEPMSGLDHFWREKLRDTLNKFRERGGTLLFSTHILPDVEALCDRVIYLNEGRIHWDGRIDEVLDKGRQMHVVLKKGDGSLPLPAPPLWERGGQVACIIDADHMAPLQQDILSRRGWKLLRATPHIPSLEAMFHHG